MIIKVNAFYSMLYKITNPLYSIQHPHFFKSSKPVKFPFIFYYNKSVFIFINIHIPPQNYLIAPEPGMATSSSHSAHIGGNS
ncbi:hypothetical protein L581_1582 [Serratia fonticola AU-AP2C]|nr:hypothetical protein L581_1582 [Serratia fonticola AU-AP2C]